MKHFLKWLKGSDNQIWEDHLNWRKMRNAIPLLLYILFIVGCSSPKEKQRLTTTGNHYDSSGKDISITGLAATGSWSSTVVIDTQKVLVPLWHEIDSLKKVIDKLRKRPTVTNIDKVNTLNIGQ